MSLPRWNEARSTRRSWKRTLRSIPKRRLFQIFRPHLEELLESSQLELGDPNQSERFLPVAERKAAILEALHEIETQGAASSEQLASRPYDFTIGLKRETAEIIHACIHLIQAMSAKHKLEQHLLDCVVCLQSLGEERRIVSLRADLEKQLANQTS